MSSQAVACFRDPNVKGDVLFTQTQGGIGGIGGIEINALFTKRPKGEHGFHIHRAGDLRGEGCAITEGNLQTTVALLALIRVTQVILEIL